MAKAVAGQSHTLPVTGWEFWGIIRYITKHGYHNSPGHLTIRDMERSRQINWEESAATFISLTGRRFTQDRLTIVKICNSYMITMSSTSLRLRRRGKLTERAENPERDVDHRSKVERCSRFITKPVGYRNKAEFLCRWVMIESAQFRTIVGRCRGRVHRSCRWWAHGRPVRDST